jgi:hypothetical protein
VAALEPKIASESSSGRQPGSRAGAGREFPTTLEWPSDLAQVRYLKAELQAAGAPPRVMPWIATIQFAYATPSNDARVRSWNPVGFKVIDFSAEPELSAVGEKNP